MDAKELDALTALLFAVWPETRPEGLVFFSNDDYEGFAIHGIDPLGELEADFLIEDRYAAALIRMAIEDALLEAGHYIIVASAGGVWLSSLMDIPDPHTWRQFGKGAYAGSPVGTVVLPNLVAAALAVAEGKRT